MMNTSIRHPHQTSCALRRFAGGAAVASGYVVTIYVLYSLYITLASRLLASGGVYPL